MSNPYEDFGYYGDTEYHQAKHGELSILTKGPADAVTFDAPLRDEPQQVIGLSVEDAEFMARLIGLAIYHGCESKQVRSRIAQRVIAEIKQVVK